MKKTKIILTVIIIALIVALIVACIVHVAAAYKSIANDAFTSAPASVAFFLIIPYALSVLICVVVLIVIYIKNRK